MSIDENLPEGWAETTLEDILPLQYGKSLTGITRDKEGTIPVYGSSGIVGYHNQALTANETLIVGRKGSVGSIYYSLVPCWPIDTVYYVEKSVSINLVFFAHLLSSLQLVRLDKSTAIPGLSRDDYNCIIVKVPPGLEQTRIVAAIEQQFTRLDSAVASLKSAQEKAKQYRASLLKSAVEGELTEEWRAEHPTSETGAQLLSRILAERRAHWEEAELAKMYEKGRTPWNEEWKKGYEEPEGPDLENLPELPEKWCWATVEQIASLEPRSIQSGPFGSALLHEEFQDSGILAIGIDNVLDGIFSKGRQHRISFQKYEELKKFTARPLDFLITVMATVGRCCVVPIDLEPAIITKHVYRISVNQTIINPYFLMHCFSGSPGVRLQLFGQVQGQTRPGINGEILRKIAIPILPLAEQAQIISEVEAQLSKIAKMEETIEHSLKRAEQERQSILREAFAGRLVEQNPEDEPASILLQRIREEREKRAEDEQLRRRENRVLMDQQRKNRKHRAPLYDVLIEASGPLPPRELYQRSEEQRKTILETERDEEFYKELDTEVTVSLIREERPAADQILLHALEQADEDLDESEENALLQPDSRKDKALDSKSKSGTHQSQADIQTPSLWDE